MTLLWVTDQQWEDCYQFAKIRKKSSYKIVVTKVNKPYNFSFLFCLIPGGNKIPLKLKIFVKYEVLKPQFDSASTNEIDTSNLKSRELKIEENLR